MFQNCSFLPVEFFELGVESTPIIKYIFRDDERRVATM